MTDRPILFKAPEVQALLDGRKTQTRRVLRNPEYFGCPTGDCPHERQSECNAFMAALEPSDVGFAVGDRLWVGETWTHTGDHVFEIYQARMQGRSGVIFAADSNPKFPHAKWWSSAQMPREFSRITLTVTDVRVERLQDISEDDAIAEGIAPLFSAAEIARHPDVYSDPMPWKNYLWHGHIGRTITGKQSDAWAHQYSSYSDAKGSFSSLWESINGPGSWEANPWIVALTFEVAP